jgi:hypothetical protein
MKKDYIILFLLAALIAASIFGVFGFISKDKEPVVKTKIVYIKKPLTTVDLEDRLLAFGVSNAWKENFGGNLKADCFQTELIAGQTIVTYCKLKKKLTP